MSGKVDINEFMSEFFEAMAADDEATIAIIEKQEPEVIDRLVSSAVRNWLTLETTIPRACELCAFFADGGCAHGIEPMDATTCCCWCRSSLESAISDWGTLTKERTERNHSGN